MKTYEVMCDECRLIYQRSGHGLFPVDNGETLGMIPLTLPRTKKLPSPLGMTATQYSAAVAEQEQVDFDFCSVACLGAFMAKRVSSDSSTNTQDQP